MRKTLIALAAAAAAITAVATPASAITRGGELDGEDHPYVGLMVATIGGAPVWRCSGALVSPTLYVTAGHCTFGADGAQLWFESDLHDGEPGSTAGYGYPFTGEVTGTPSTHPQYVDAAFYRFDLGVVVLDTPVHLDEYATLASLDYVDGMTKGRNKNTSTVTAVGYGLQKVVDGARGVGQDFVQDDKTRYQADLMIVNTNGVAGLGSLMPNQAFTMSGDAKHGGTCFGDSGGPILADGNVIVGVNSFGLNSNCAGIGGAYRVDQSDDIAFLASFGAYDG